MKFGVVGTNFITDRLVTAMRLDARVEVAAVCSRTEKRGREYAAQWGIPQVYTSVEEMCGAVDAVYIATPNACHAPQAIACMERGRHVLCEKPLAASAADARRMVAAARANGVMLMEAMKPTLTPAWKTVCGLVGEIGAVRRWFAAFGKYSSRYDRLKAGELPNAFRPELGNGAVMDIGVYAIWPMVAMFGKPRRVEAMAVMLDTGVDGHGVASFDYGGMLGTVMYSKIVDMALPWEIEGEEGTIRGDAINSIGRLEFRKRGEEWREVAIESCGNDYYYEVAHFVDCIEAGMTESPVNKHEVSLAVMEILDEIRGRSW